MARRTPSKAQSGVNKGAVTAACWPFYNEEGRPYPIASQILGADWRSEDWRRENWRRENWRNRVRVVTSALEIIDAPAARPIVTLGWIPDVPDLRDRTIRTPAAQKLLSAAHKSFRGQSLPKESKPLPTRHENLYWCSPIEDQGALGSCTAQAVVGLMEFMQRRVGEHVDGSRLFTYKVSRKLLGWKGDTGAHLRTAIKSVAAFGVPPEEFWPYEVKRFDEEPTSFLYAFAQRYRALEYTRLDEEGKKSAETLEDIKRVLVSGLAVVFGFSVYSSMSTSPDIPLPTARDRLEGGHAVMAVGYDDEHKLPDGHVCPSLIIRNSWGIDWGAQGYGFLPYEYVLKGLADDFWTVLKAEWLEAKFD